MLWMWAEFLVGYVHHTYARGRTLDTVFFLCAACASNLHFFSPSACLTIIFSVGFLLFFLIFRPLAAFDTLPLTPGN